MPDPDVPPIAVSAEGLPYALLRAGLLPPGRYLEAVRLVRDDGFWRRWGRTALLVLAVGQILAGIVFFFAFNWADLPPLAKLGLIQGGIVLCAAGAWFGRASRLAWEALLTAAAVLVGVLLAVFGQIYQTGADAYSLFVGWGVLILPWVALSRGLAPLVLWLAVAGTGGATYAAQIAIPMDWIGPEAVAALLALFYTAALALTELAAWRGIGWLRALWLRRLLATVILAISFVAAAPAVFDEPPEPAGWMAMALFAAAVAGLGFAGRRWRDLPVVALAVLAGCLFLNLASGRLAFEAGDDIGGSFLLLAAVAIIFGGALSLLRRVRTAMAAEAAAEGAGRG
ncbi:MAG: DUF2157 domain-containing protein [Thalassobaculum sp.]|uniref:DUF2157 domain-containing protein n=1 Tax=Thalassobaculum sp. TaxID=2022740 RepID=UPI0032EC705A